MATAEEIKKRMISGPAFSKGVKPRRKSARQQVREAEERLMDDIIRHLREKKRVLPQQCELGLQSAISRVEEIKSGMVKR
jgi:hypothetical protein